MIKEIKTRRSIRKFKDKKVEKKDLVKLLKAAMHAPTAKNTQDWLFYVTQDKEIFKELVQIKYYHMFDTASAAIVVCGDTNLFSKKEYNYVDAAAATQNILLEAKSMGLGTCWCAVGPNADRIKLVRKQFKIAKNALPIALIAIGYPAETKKIINRYDEKKVTWL